MNIVVLVFAGLVVGVIIAVGVIIVSGALGLGSDGGG